jgi:hypothetical protein
VAKDRDMTEKGEKRGRMSRFSTWVQEHRRLTVGLAVGLGLFLVLFVIPGRVATQPSFMQRYENLESHYGTWETSVHSKVRCQECHANPGIIPQTVFNVKMLGEAYASWVTERNPDVFHTPVNGACENCHVDLRQVSAAGDLKIPHRAHVDALGLACVECHDNLVHVEPAEGDRAVEGENAPTMETCLGCHDGEQAKNGCTECHTDKAAPDDHQTAEWLIVHPDMQEEIDCAECHGWVENWCEECHTRRPPSHTETWRKDHPSQVEERRNCEACHVGEFCIECHGEVPALNLAQAPELAE